MSVVLTSDDARALLDQYAEGMLDDATAAAVAQAIAQDDALRAEAEAMKATLGALHALPPPPAPDDMVARVRRQLAAEKAEALSAADSAHRGSEAHETLAPVVALVPARSRWMEWGIGLAAAAALVVGVVLGGQSAADGTPEGINAAGVGGATQGQGSLVVTGVPVERVWALAADHGMSADTPDGLVFTGVGDDAARFHLALLREAAERGGSVEGLPGRGDLVELRISLRPAR